MKSLQMTAPILLILTACATSPKYPSSISRDLVLPNYSIGKEADNQPLTVEKMKFSLTHTEQQLLLAKLKREENNHKLGIMQDNIQVRKKLLELRHQEIEIARKERIERWHVANKLGNMTFWLIILGLILI